MRIFGVPIFESTKHITEEITSTAGSSYITDQLTGSRDTSSGLNGRSSDVLGSNEIVREAIFNVGKRADETSDKLTDISELLAHSDINMWKLLSELRVKALSKAEEHAELNAMEEDVVIASALEMYADDATLTDETGASFRIETDNEWVRENLTAYAEDIQIAERLWDWAFQLCKYGELYLERFKDEKGRAEKYIEEYSQPSKIFNLQLRGKTIHFATVVDESSQNQANLAKYLLHPADKFIHICLPRSDKYDILKLNLTSDANDITEFRVKRGTSILLAILSNYRILRLLEDSLVVGRLSKSQIIRLFTLEVGNTPPKRVRDMISRFKSLIEGREKLDVGTGMYRNQRTPGPIDSSLVIPTKQGVGALTYQAIGGDVDVKSIIDIDYFRNKNFAGLKIPKPFLGFDELISSTIGSSPLVKLDIRYARAVRKIQKYLAQGLTNLFNLHLMDQNKPHLINTFRVTLISPTTAEDTDRVSELDSRLRLVEGLTAFIDKFKDAAELPAEAKYILDSILRLPELSNILDDSLKAKVASLKIAVNPNVESESSDNFSYSGVDDTESGSDIPGGSSDTESTDANLNDDTADTETETSEEPTIKLAR